MFEVTLVVAYAFDSKKKNFKKETLPHTTQCLKNLIIEYKLKPFNGLKKYKDCKAKLHADTFITFAQAERTILFQLSTNVAKKIKNLKQNNITGDVTNEPTH